MHIKRNYLIMITTYFQKMKTNKNLRKVTLLSVYLAFCVQLVVLGCYFASSTITNLDFPFLLFVVLFTLSMIPLVFMCLIDKKVMHALVLGILGLTLLFVDFISLPILIFVFVFYYLGLFFTMYEFKI